MKALNHAYATLKTRFMSFRPRLSFVTIKESRYAIAAANRTTRVETEQFRRGEQGSRRRKTVLSAIPAKIEALKNIMSSFEVPKKTLRWAKNKIDEFETQSNAALKQHMPKIITSYDAATSRNVIYPSDAYLPPELLEPLEEGAYRIIGDLRNALDQACFAASFAITGVDSDKAGFPLATDDVDFDRRIANPKGNYGGIPIVLHSELKAFEPFWVYKDGRKGNEKLRALGKFANPNKHKVPLSVSQPLYGVGFTNVWGVDFEINPIKRQSKPDRPEIHWKSTSPNFRLEAEFMREIRLTNAGVLSHGEAIAIFKELNKICSDIVENLEIFVNTSKST